MCSIWAPVILKVRFLNQTSQNPFGIIARFEGLQDISRLFFVQKMILFKYIRDFPFPARRASRRRKHVAAAARTGAETGTAAAPRTAAGATVAACD